MNDLEIVAAVREAYKEARRLENERDRVRRESEAIGIDARKAWDEVYRLEGLLRLDPLETE